MGCSESGKDANNLKPKLHFPVNDKYVTDVIAWKLLIVLSSLSRLDLNLQIIF